jgi:hypothetical protein
MEVQAEVVVQVLLLLLQEVQEIHLQSVQHKEKMVVKE